MAAQQATPNYWLILGDRESFDTKGQAGAVLWLELGPARPEMKPGDIAYLWQVGDESLAGRGYVSSEPFLSAPRLDKWGRSTSEVYTVRVTFVMPVAPPIRRAELSAEWALESLLPSTRRQFMRLSAEEAAALNNLIENRGAAIRPEPAAAKEAAAGKAGAKKEGAGGDLTLGRALELFTFSGFVGETLKQAADFALDRAGRGYGATITTSCLMFAIAEGGRRGAEKSDASKFFFAWLRGGAGLKYEEVLGKFKREQRAPELRPEPPPAVTDRKDLHFTPRASRVVQKALEVTARTTRGDTIYSRHLLGALITETAAIKSGAAGRLAAIKASLAGLRQDFYDFLSRHPSAVSDDMEAWRILLLEGAPPEASGEAAEPARLPESFLPRIDADDLRGEDRLGIMAEVRAFASIIAARDVKTPLSIGLFGDWGSGKSFFISKLKEEVSRIAGRVRAKEAGEETAFLGNVVQIDFNAWHYAEANLWASRVSHVFENLSLSDEHDRRKAEERKRLLLAQLDTTLGARREAESEVAARRREEESARAALERARREQTDAGIKLSRALGREVWGLVREQVGERPDVKRVLEDASARLGRAGLPANLSEFRQELAATRAAAGQAHGYLSSVANDPRRWLKVLLILAATLLVPLVATYALARWPVGEAWGRVIPSVAPVLTLLGGAAAWLRSRRGEVERALSVLGEASRRLDEMYESARAEHDREVSELRSRLDAKEAEVKTAAGALAEAERGVRETVAALRELEPGAVLERFVTERAASEDYRKLLGVVALIRRDFKKLSDLLSQQGDAELREAVRRKLLKDREERGGARGGGGARPDDAEVERVLGEYRIDRIVLYIDDLDRCPPKQVVDVLQAIHLLLAFELFVVVVGVDARWVRHSLREQFPALLSGEADEGDPHRVKAATPRDYIEKIFQVPFWLRPMSHEGSTDLLRGLIPDAELRPAAGGQGEAGSRAEEPATAARRESAARAQDGGLPRQTTPPSGDTRAGVGAFDAPREPAATSPASATGGEVAAFALRPDNLLLEAKERDAMVKLAKVIGRTPRTLKRFVNVYRIIKAGLRGERLEAFIGRGDDDGEFRAVLLLLAVAHGAPEASTTFFRMLKGRHIRGAVNKEEVGLKSFLDEMLEMYVSVSVGGEGKVTPSKPSGEAPPAGWTEAVLALIKFAEAYDDDIPLDVLCKWSHVVVRYTFQLGDMSEEFV